MNPRGSRPIALDVHIRGRPSTPDHARGQAEHHGRSSGGCGCERGRRWCSTVLCGLSLLGTGPSAADVPSVTASSTGYVLPVPAPPLVLTPFAPPANRYGAGHRGVDLAAQPGSTVTAAGTGRVVFAGGLAGRGVVSVEHSGGLRTTYEPVTASVAAGSTVAAGQPIGVLEPGHARMRTGELLALGRPVAGPRLPGSDVVARPVAGPVAALGRSIARSTIRLSTAQRPTPSPVCSAPAAARTR